MSTISIRLARLEAAFEPSSPEDDRRAREEVAAQLHRMAVAFQAEAERCAERGEPVPVRSESPAESLVRAAMAEAAQDGPWGSGAYSGTFWRAAARRLSARVNRQRSNERN